MKSIEIYKRLMDEYLEMYKSKYVYFKEHNKEKQSQEYLSRLIGSVNICNFMGLLTDKERITILREISQSYIVTI